jgi:hypothetical protein
VHRNCKLIESFKEKKQYVVWYNGGSGGFITSWLIQLCLDPSKLPNAFENFPDALKKKHSIWRRYEQVPPNVGLMCNAFDCRVYYDNNKNHTRKILDRLISTDTSSVYELFYCRSKYFLVNHVYEKGNATNEDYQRYSKEIEKYQTADINYFKAQTDILFEPDKIIFVHAPIEYQRIAQQTKQSRDISFDIGDALAEYSGLNCFEIRSIWDQTYIQNLERVLNQKVSVESQKAIKVLVDHYLSISPPALRKYCEEEWNI